MKRTLSIVLTALMIISVFSVMSFTADAENTPKVSTGAKTISNSAKANWDKIRAYVGEEGYYEKIGDEIDLVHEYYDIKPNNDNKLYLQYEEYDDSYDLMPRCDDIVTINELDYSTNIVKCEVYHSHNVSLYEKVESIKTINFRIDEFGDPSKYQINPEDSSLGTFNYGVKKINAKIKDKFGITLEDLGFGQPLVEAAEEPTTTTPNPVNGNQIINYLPDKNLYETSDTIKLVVQDDNGNITNYNMIKTSLVYDGVPVYTAEIPAASGINTVQIQYYKGEKKVAQFNISGSQIKAANGKTIDSVGRIYNVSNASKKKTNPIKVSVKTKAIKLKKLKKKNQKVKALTVKNAQGKVTYKLIKKGSAAKLYKQSKINSKGVITVKKWKKAKKGTYKLNVKITAKGNDKFNKKTVSKVVKVKIK